jgi:polyphenol oxidase
MNVEVIRTKSLDGIAHGFMGRKGGVSTGIYASLNITLGSRDDRAAVIENRRRAREAILSGADFARVYQIHSADVVSVFTGNDACDPPQGDALVTDRPNLLLGISTADCVPVLCADPQSGVVGAAHSGWKGALGGVNENMLAAMEKLGARRDQIICAIGPCIAQRSYEVDDDFLRRFAAVDPANERFFGSGVPGHHQFDIEGYVASRLAAAGIGTIECLGEDTYSQPERFFSYRRSCHQQEADYGTQISLIGLR